jgi:hypothetical protein
VEELKDKYSQNICQAIPYMRKVLRKNTTATGFIGDMYAVGSRTGYEGDQFFNFFNTISKHVLWSICVGPSYFSR